MILKKEFSQDDMINILRSDAVIPESVDKRMKETYEKLGLMEEGNSKKAEGRRMVRRKKRRAWVSIAAAAALAAGLGVTVYAVGHLLNADLKEEDGKLTYALDIDPEVMEAHEIKAEPTYVPEGYTYQEDGNYSGKWRNEEKDGTLSLITYNASELYLMSQTEDDPLTAPRDKDDLVETIEIDGMETQVFAADSIFSDDTSKRQDTILLNEEYGYAVHVFLTGTDLPEGEAVKVTEGLKIDVLDSTVPYPTEEEIAKIKKAQEEQEASFEAEIDESMFLSTGETIVDPQGNMNTEYKVKDIRVMDALPLDQFPKENYILDYDSEIAPLLNEDGTLKPHSRYTEKIEGISSGSGKESANGKFVVVTVEITNAGDQAEDTYVTPMMELLRGNDAGSLERYVYTPDTESYHNLNVEGEPCYQSVQVNTENEKKHVRFIDLDAGESVEITFAYVVDEDCLDDAYAAFFDCYGGMTNSYPRVKVTK